MTTAVITGPQVAERLSAAFPGAIVEVSEGSVTVQAEHVVEIAGFLRDDPELDCKYLNCLVGIDWMEHFDVVYVLSSLAKNHTLTLEARTSHDDPVVPSVSGIWQGAHLQEREVYDLMGIAFSGHPDLKRIFLWEGFPGHPLRKDFLALPGGYKPGLQRFPFEFPEGQRDYPNLSQPEGPRAPSVPRLVGPLPGQVAAEETGGGQLGSLGGGSTETREPSRDVAPEAQEASEALDAIEAPKSLDAAEAPAETKPEGEAPA
jgi:NADH-quinone oxidoreductase subunit C